jgi:hypothetical protein
MSVLNDQPREDSALRCFDAVHGAQGVAILGPRSDVVQQVDRRRIMKLRQKLFLIFSPMTRCNAAVAARVSFRRKLPAMSIQR